MDNCDAIFEYVCTASVRPDMETHSEEFLVVSFTPEPDIGELPATMLIFTDTHNLGDIDVRKLTNAIYYFVCRYGCTDESKLNFLLWYTHMLCNKLNNDGLQFEGAKWFFAPKDIRFIVGPYRTNFVTLHIFDEGCFTPAEMDVLMEVGANFKGWVLEDIEADPQYEGGERELVMA